MQLSIVLSKEGEGSQCDGVSSSPIQLSVDPWTAVATIKNLITDVTGIPSDRQRLFTGPTELKNQRFVDDYHVSDGATLRLVYRVDCAFYIMPHDSDPALPAACTELLAKVQQGFAKGLSPQLAMEGTGGAYFLRDARGKKVAVFKPSDEEPYAPCNPRGHVGALGSSGLNRGILSGEAYLREVAAYLLDHDNFAGVPVTLCAEARHSAFHTPDHPDSNAINDLSSLPAPFFVPSSMLPPAAREPESTAHQRPPSSAAKRGSTEVTPAPLKVGSLQEFVDSDDTSGNLSPSLFSRHEVHKIAILDLRILNTDRNDANILAKFIPVSSSPPVTPNSSANSSPTSSCPSASSSIVAPAPTTSSCAASDDQKGGPQPRMNSPSSQQAPASQGSWRLTPIDHGFSIPDCLNVAWCDWIWLNWPQAKEPFDQETLAYIAKIDVDRDMELLRTRLGLREPNLELLKLSSLLLKKGAAAGLNLFQIASIIVRSDMDSPSELEQMCSGALSRVTAATAEADDRAASNGSTATRSTSSPQPALSRDIVATGSRRSSHVPIRKSESRSTHSKKNGMKDFSGSRLDDEDNSPVDETGRNRHFRQASPSPDGDDEKHEDPEDEIFQIDDVDEQRRPAMQHSVSLPLPAPLQSSPRPPPAPASYPHHSSSGLTRPTLEFSPSRDDELRPSPRLRKTSPPPSPDSDLPSGGTQSARSRNGEVDPSGLLAPLGTSVLTGRFFASPLNLLTPAQGPARVSPPRAERMRALSLDEQQQPHLTSLQGAPGQFWPLVTQLLEERFKRGPPTQTRPRAPSTFAPSSSFRPTVTGGLTVSLPFSPPPITAPSLSSSVLGFSFLGSSYMMKSCQDRVLSPARLTKNPDAAPTPAFLLPPSNSQSRPVSSQVTIPPVLPAVKQGGSKPAPPPLPVSHTVASPSQVFKVDADFDWSKE